MSASWFHRQRRGWRKSWMEWRHRRAVARHKRLVAAEESARRKRAKGPSWATLAFQRFQIWRRLRQERQAAVWQRRRAKHRWVDWLFKKQALVFWGTFGILVALFWVFILRENARENSKRAARTGPDNRAVVIVNGTEVPYSALIAHLELQHGAGVLQKLTEQEVVRQEAERLKLTVSPEERQMIDSRLQGDPLRVVHERELLTSLLLRKMALLRVDRARKEKVYRDFAADLKLYALAGYRFKDRKAAQGFLDKVQAGESPARAAKALALDGESPLALGTFTLPQIQEQLGLAASKAISACSKGGLTRPLAAAGGIAVYRLDGVADKFEDVEPAIDSLIAEADSNQILFELLSKASIESPFLQRNLLAPSPSPTPKT